MDTLDCDRYKLLVVLPRSSDVSTSPVGLGHFTLGLPPNRQSQQEARAPPPPRDDLRNPYLQPLQPLPPESSGGRSN